MNNVQNDNLISLVKDVQNGVDGAFDKLYRETIKFSYNIASFLLKNEEDIEDALQNSYMYVARYIKDLKKPESFENWLAVIVRHECQKHIAAHKRVGDIFSAVIKSEELDFSDEADLPDDLFDSDERRSAVRKIVDSLPDDKRACIVLYYFEQRSLPEIAEILGIPEGTVKSRLYKARKILEKEFTKLRKKDDTFYGLSIIPLIISFFAWQSKNAVIPVSVAEGAAVCVAAAETAVTVGASASAAAGGTTVATGTAAAGTVGGATAAVTTKAVAVAVAATVVTGGSVATVSYVNDHKENGTTSPTVFVEEHTTAVEKALAEMITLPSETVLTENTSATTLKNESTVTAASHTTVPHTESSRVTTTKPVTATTRPVTTTKPATTTKPVTTARPVTTTSKATTTAAPTTNAADIYSVSNGVLSEYTGSGGNVSVPSSVGSENVTAIGTGAFEGNTGITSLSLPSTVTRIGQSAFADCANLRSVSLPSSLQSIGLGAFCNCTSLASVSIPSGVTTIGDDAFADCSSLSTVTIPSSVTSIGDNALGGCDNLTIKCSEGSAAHDYAVENSINYELI